MRSASSWSALFALCLSACGGGDDASPAATPAPAVEPDAKTQVMYGPASSTKLTPFPSNRYARPDATSKTGLRVAIGADTTADVFVSTYPTQVAELNANDGFSTVGGAVVHFTGPVDPATLTGAARLVNVDPSSPGFGDVVAHDELYFPTDPEELIPAGDYALVLAPRAPLRPRTRYALALTDAVKDASGARVGPSSDTRALLSGAAAGAYEDDVRAALTTVRERAALGDAKIVLATVFTTLGPHDELLAGAAALAAAPAPVLTSIEVAKDGKRDVDPVRVGFTGRFDAAEYRSQADRKFVLEGGAPRPQLTVSLPFNLDFSDKKSSGPRPVVIFAHGLNGDRDGTWGTSERLAALSARGVAVIGIDSPEHGDRKPSKDSFPTFSFFGIDAATGTFDMGRARDNFRQMTLDQLALMRLIGTLGSLDVLPVGAPDGVPDLDVGAVVYIGHSFGSVQGATFLALTRGVRAAVLNVGGAGLTTLMRDSNTFKVLVNGFRPPGTRDGDVARFFVAAQGIVDAGDAANFAQFVLGGAPPGAGGWAPTSVLLQEVVNDTIVPNSSTSLLAHALGLAQAGPAPKPIAGLTAAPVPLAGNLGGGAATGGVFQFAMMDGKKAEHGGLIFTEDARRQYVRFFADALSGAPPSIVAP
ncbi:MAG: hypothetical protein IT374_25270 [Polyangiaceae bacterium]|nr:hypothetical protein [Polyangiaceae bacterium]